MSDDNEIEALHFVCGKIFVFQVPKLEAADGYKAASWPKEHIWSGRLRVVSLGKTTSVVLEHTDKDGLFAACPIKDSKTVEQTVDSSRYFVLRVSDGKGRHAVIGIGFNDRTQAFDFKVAIQDLLNSTKETEYKPVAPLADLSIPTGGKIHVALGGGGEKKKKKNEGESGGLGGFKIAPPPAGGAVPAAAAATGEKKKKKKKDAEEPGSGGSAGSSGFDDFAAGSSGFDDWAGSSSGSNSTKSSSSSSKSSSATADIPSDWVQFG